MRLVVVGNGVAGVTTARFVAERDPLAEITVLSGETYPYYPRPRLIDLLAGTVNEEQMSFYPEAWYEQRHIRALLGAEVAAIRPQEHEVLLRDGRSFPYDSLVLATGARSWVPPIAGAQLGGVHTLRTLDDALHLRERARRTRQATVLGGGLLGLDTAMALRASGVKVRVVEVMPRLLPRQLDQEGAGLLQGMIEARGVEVVVQDSCRLMEGDGEVERLHLQSGRVVPSRLVVISAGVRPNVELAQRAGLDCGRGILVDEHLHTSAADVYAAGDAAEFQGKNWCIIPTALAQARVAAAQIVGDSTVLYDDTPPSTTLQVTGIDVTSLGEVNPEGDGHTELRHLDRAKGQYRKLVLRGNRAVGAILVGDRASVGSVSQLVSGSVDVALHPELLRKAGFDAVAVSGVGG